ncbi:hypothetical protein G6F57_019147 [Rhizopus arrhizus]|nr:hypothetical protein G6F57_019147 [Rhizopus arrhizus]
MRGLCLAAGVEVPEHVGQRVAHRIVAHRDGHVGRVVELPDLEILADLVVAHQLVGNVDPGFRAAGQAMDHQQHAPVRIVGLHHVQVRRVDAALAAEQRAQRLVAEVGSRQPQRVAGGKVRRQRYLLPVQGDFGDLVGIVDLQFRLVVVQHFP